jgi:hypothetical protein
MMIKNCPGMLAFSALVLFCISLFLGDSKIQATMQVTTQVITGYFAYLIQPKDEKEHK